jgi:hypothetical protein
MLLVGSRRIDSVAPSPPLSIEAEMPKDIVYRFDPVPFGEEVRDSFHHLCLFSQILAVGGKTNEM